MVCCQRILQTTVVGNLFDLSDLSDLFDTYIAPPCYATMLQGVSISAHRYLNSPPPMVKGFTSGEFFAAGKIAISGVVKL